MRVSGLCQGYGIAGKSFFRYEPDPFSVMARPACSDCGKSGIEWMPPDALLARVPESKRARVRDGIEFAGPGGDAWLCPACGGYGLFGPTNFG